MIKNHVILLIICVTLTACSNQQMSEPGKIEVFASASSTNIPKVVSDDSLAQPHLDHIFLNVEEVQVHRDSSAWETISTPHQVFDFLQLTDTMTVVLADTLVQPGHYSQIRLIVADTNEVVIDGVSYPLTVPSGTQTGVKLNVDVSIDGGETAQVYLEFDEETAIVKNANGYYLRPSFRLNVQLQP